MKFETVPALQKPELYYLGAGVYEFIMPDCDVKMTAKFVPAQGKSHKISTTCANGTAVADCDVDENLQGIAKAGEFIQFVVLPEEGCKVADGGFVAKVDGKVWKQYWFVGQFYLEDMGTVYVYEMVMPDGDVNVTINCTKSAKASAAEVRIPVTVE